MKSELITEAVQFLRGREYIQVTDLQKRFDITYVIASHLLAQLQLRGYVLRQHGPKGYQINRGKYKENKDVQ